MVKHQPLPTRSWVDLPHSWNTSHCLLFDFCDRQTYFCLPNTVTNLRSAIFLISGTFHPKRWSLSSPYPTSLKQVPLGFQSPESRPHWESRSLPPPKRSIFPALKELHFTGATEYLEELVNRIDTQQLDEIHNFLQSNRF